MYDHLAAVGQAIFPGEVVVVLDADDGALAERGPDAGVDVVVAGGGVVAGQGHGGPVFRAGVLADVQPGEILQLAGQATLLHGQVGIMHGQLRAHAPGAGVRQQGEVTTGRAAKSIARGQVCPAELHEVVTAAAGAQLLRGLTEQGLRGGEVGKRFVGQHRVVVGALVGLQSEGGLFAQDGRQPVLVRIRQLTGQVINRKAHPATDIDAHTVGNHGVLSGQYAADGQAVAVVGIRHQRTGGGDGQAHRVVQLLHGIGRNARLTLEYPERAGRLPHLRVVNGRRRLRRQPAEFPGNAPPVFVFDEIIRVSQEVSQRRVAPGDGFPPERLVHHGNRQAGGPLRPAAFDQVFCS